MPKYSNQKTSSIKISSGTITISSPNTSSSWDAGSSFYIYWSSTGTIDNVAISLYEGGSYDYTIISPTTNDGEYYWTISSSLSDSEDYQIKIENYDDSSSYDYSDYFTISSLTTSTSIKITSPTSSSEWDVGEEYTIMWTSSGYIGYVDILLYVSDSEELTIEDDVYDDGSYDWEIPSDLESSTEYQIKIVDSSDSSTYDYSEDFEIVGKESPSNSYFAVTIVIVILVIVGVVIVCVVIGSSQKKPEIKTVIGPTPPPPVPLPTTILPVQPPKTIITPPSTGPPIPSVEPELEKMNMCPYCGSPLEKGARFCTYCGIELQNGVS